MPNRFRWTGVAAILFMQIHWAWSRPPYRNNRGINWHVLFHAHPFNPCVPHGLCLIQWVAVNEVWSGVSTSLCTRNLKTITSQWPNVCTPLASTIVSIIVHRSQRQRRAVKVYAFGRHSVNDMAVILLQWDTSPHAWYISKIETWEFNMSYSKAIWGYLLQAVINIIVSP